MKKQLVLSITIVSLLAIIISGSTYAYFSTVVKGNGNDVLADSAEFGVIYNKGNPLTGDIEPTISKEDGLNTSVNIKLSKVLSGVTGDILLNVTNISNNLKINGFKWESYKVEGNTETLLKSGNFANATNSSVISLVDNLPLSTTLTTIKVYIWLDGNDLSVDNNVADGTASFSGYISAKSNRLTGILDRYTVTLDANGGTMPNLIYGLDDVGNTSSGRIVYSILNGVVTVASNVNDGSGYTTGRVYLEAGKNYIFSCDTDANYWGYYNADYSIDSVEAFLILDGKYPGTLYNMSNNNNFRFTPTVSGTYWLRLDVNKAGETHTFSNISITETAKEITYGQSYGTLPTPTREGYTFKGWHGKNLYDVNNRASVTSGITVDDDDWITINTSNGTRYYNYFTHNLDVEENTQYTLALEIGNVSNITGGLNVVSGQDNAGISQFYGKAYTNSELINNSTYVYTLRSRTNVSLDVGLRTFYNNLNYDTSGILTFRLSVMNKDTSITSENFAYEPYYITSSTTVVQDKNHTLKAIWEPNS